MTKMEIPSALASVAKPGTFGNLERGALQGPVFSQIDLVLAKHCPFGGGRHVRDNHQHGGCTVGLGTSRQVQFALRLNF